MDPFDSEKEQLEALRNWWKENGLTIVAGLVIGLGAVFGWNGWQAWQRHQQEQASVAYEQLADAAAAGRREAAEAMGRKLMEEHPDSRYAALGALLLARVAHDGGDTALARRHLQWVLEHSGDPDLELIARLRLARLTLEAGDPDGALALLAVEDPGAFGPEFEELRGDIRLAQGQRDEARSHYEQALASGELSPTARARLELKLQSLGRLNAVAGAR